MFLRLTVLVSPLVPRTPAASAAPTAGESKTAVAAGRIAPA